MIKFDHDRMASFSAASPLLGPAGWSLIAVASLWTVMSLTYPFGWDQGILAWAGDVVLRGGLPYRDAWDMKGPAAFYGFALTQAIFGVHLWGIRVVDAALLLMATISIGRAASKLTDPRVGCWSAILFFLWYASHSYWHTAQPDGWVAMLMAVVMLPALVDDEPIGVRYMGLMGTCVGLTTLIKPIYAVFIVLPLICVIRSRTTRQLAAGAAVLGGWLLPIVLCAVWFEGHGAFDDLLAVYVRYPATAYAELGTLGLDARARGIVEYLFQAQVVTVALPIVIAGAPALWEVRRTAMIVLVSWILLAGFVVVLQGWFFSYHWLPVLPAAVLLAAVGFHSLLPRAKAFALTLLAVIVFHCLAPIVWEELRFVSWATGGTDTAAYYDGYGEAGQDMRAVQWLDENRAEGKVFVFGWNTSIAWLSHRETVSRFGFSMPLMIGEGLDIRAEYRNELLRALRTDPPQFIIVGTQAQRILRQSMTLADFPALADLVHDSYKKVAEFGAIQIHERRAAVARDQ